MACSVPTGSENPLDGLTDAGAVPEQPDSAQPDAAIDTPDAQVPESDAPMPIEVEAAPAFAAAIASGPAQRFVVWVDERNGDQDIYGSRVDADGQIADPGGKAISTQPGNEHRPDIVWTGEHYLVAWMDRRDQGTRIYAARVDADGVLLDPAGFPISPNGDFSQLPKLASDGAGGALAVYEGPCGDQCTGVVAVPISSSGHVSPSVVLAASTGREPAIAFNGSEYFVAYTDFRSGASDVYGRYLDSSGVASGGEVTISAASGSQQTPTVAAGDSGLLVAWVDTQSGALEHSWAQVDGMSVVGHTSIAGVRWQDPPRAGFSNGRYLLVWTENSFDGEAVQTHVASIDEATNVSSTNLIYETADGPGTDDKKPAIACGTQSCSIAWHQSMELGRSVLGVITNSAGSPLDAEPTLWSTILASDVE